MAGLDDLSTVLKYLTTFGAGALAGRYAVPILEKRFDEREERKIQKYAERRAEAVKNEIGNRAYSQKSLYGTLEKIESRLGAVEKKLEE